MLVYQYPANVVDPGAPHLLPVPEQGVTVFETFHTAHKAHAAAEALSNKLTPAQTGTVFGQSIFVTTRLLAMRSRPRAWGLVWHVVHGVLRR